MKKIKVVFPDGSTAEIEEADLPAALSSGAKRAAAEKSTSMVFPDGSIADVSENEIGIATKAGAKKKVGEAGIGTADGLNTGTNGLPQSTSQLPLPAEGDVFTYDEQSTENNKHGIKEDVQFKNGKWYWVTSGERASKRKPDIANDYFQREINKKYADVNNKSTSQLPLQGGSADHLLSDPREVFSFDKFSEFHKPEANPKLVVPTVKPSTLAEAHTEDKNWSGNLRNYLIRGLESIAETSKDLVFGALATVAPESVLGGKPEEIVKLYRTDPSLQVTGKLEKAIGADVTEEEKKNFEEGFISSSVGGLVQSIPAIISPKGTKLAALFFQGYDGGLKSINASKEAENLDEGSKTIFAGTVGAAQAVLEKYGLDKIFGKISSKVATNLAVKTLKGLMKESDTPITADIFEQALAATTKGLKKKLIDAGGKIGSASLIEFTTGAGQELSTVITEIASNKLTGKPIFEDASWKEYLRRIAYSGAQEAVGGGILGTASIPFNRTRNYIAEKVADAKSPEDIALLKQELIQTAEAKEDLSDEEKIQFEKTIDDYVRVNQKIPSDIEQGRAELSEKIIEREEIQNEVTKKLEEVTTVDDAFKPMVRDEMEALKNRSDEINDEIKVMSGIETDTKLSVPIEGLDEQGVPIEENISQSTEVSNAPLIEKRDAIKIAVDNADDIKLSIYRNIAKTGGEEDINNLLEAVSGQWHDEGTREQTERDFGLPIVEAAKKLFPQESQKSLSIPTEENKKSEPVDVSIENKNELKDVESTAKALKDVSKIEIDKLKELAAKKEYYINQKKVYINDIGDVQPAKLLAEAYHADKAAGKETDLTKAVESLLSKEQTQEPPVDVSIENKNIELTQQEIFDDIKNKKFTTAEYNSESDIPEVWKDKVSSSGETNGKKIFRVTLPTSQFDYESKTGISKKVTDYPTERIEQKALPSAKEIKSDKGIVVDKTQENIPEKIEPPIEPSKEDVATEKKGKYEEAAKKLAEKVRSGKINKLGGFKTSTGFDAVWDGAMEAVATSLELSGKAADAVQKAIEAGFEYIKKTDWYKGLTDKKDFEEKYREHLNKELGENAPPKPPIDDNETETGNEGDGKRRFTQQELNNPDILTEAKAEIAKNINYIIQTNALSVAEAKRILDSIGVDEAYDLVVNNKELKPAVRVVMGQTLILKYNDLASKATNDEDKNYYHDKTIAAANYVAEELGTKPGQMIQALSLFQRLTPEAQLRAATKEVKEQSKKKRAKSKKDVDAVGDKFKKVNEETVDKIIGSEKVKDKVNKTGNFTIKKAKDKIEQAKIKRENIIKKYKGDKGKTLYSSPTGLTSEGIEFVGNLAKTYLDEGIANVELIVAKVIQHLKDASGKPINDEVEKNVNDIVSENFLSRADKRIATNLKDLEKTVGEIIRKHYTVEDDTKKTLTEKFVTDAGLEENGAAQLAKEIETEFDNIATRKKNEILQQEKTRFDRIQKGMQGSKKVEPKTLHDAMIRYSNLGAFSNESLNEMIAQKLGLGSLSVEEGAKIIELSKKIQKAPEGSPKNEATEDLLKYRAQLKGTTYGEMGQAIWYANILSGYGTHIKNIVSTFYNTMSFAATELVRDPKSLPVLLLGGAKGVRRGLTEAWHTITTGRSPIHISKIETPQTLERVKFKGGLLNPYNYLKFVGRLMVAEDVLQFQALKEMRATQLAYREAKKLGYSNPFSQKTWRIIDDKLLNTKERYAEVLEQIKEEGVTGIEARRRIYELMEATRPIQMIEDSYGFAAKGTFNYEPSGTLGALTTAISSVLDLSVGGVKPLRFVVPFTRILTNVANNMLDFSPVGFIRAYRGVRGFESFEGTKFKDAYYEMSKEERQQTIARASLGIGLTLALYAMTQIKGDDDEPLIEITGSGTGDYRKDIQLKQSGWQPYSIKVGDKYYSYALTPLLLNLGWIGNRNDREKYDSKFNEESELKRLMMSVYQSGQMLSDMTWVGSSADVLKSFASLRPSEIGKGLESTLKNSAKGFIIPNAYSQLAQKYEQINNIPQKEVNGLFDELIQDIPIARNRLNDRINALGDTITRDRDLLVSKETKDPIWKFLLDKKGWVAPVNKNSLIILESKTKEERKATEDEYYEFSKLRGSKIKASIKNIMDNGALLTVKDGQLEVTTQRNIATGSKLAKDLTTYELRKLLKAIATKATKETKKELFSGIAEIQDED